MLVKIPYQRFSNATELQRFFSAERKETEFAIEIDAELDGFFSAIFQRGQKELWSKDYPKFVHIGQLEEDGVLIVPLGKAPMIATQTYVLLSKKEGVSIKKVAVIHPKNAEICNGARLLKELFRQKGVEFEDIEINELEDITSEADCQIYLEKLVSLIDRLQKNNPDKSIHLSLSGGRKGMAALALFAAQQAGIKTVYHTLINDFSLEEQIEKETSLDALSSHTRKKKAERLFLDCYDDSKFEIFRIPVIPMLFCAYRNNT